MLVRLSGEAGHDNASRVSTVARSCSLSSDCSKLSFKASALLACAKSCFVLLVKEKVGKSLCHAAVSEGAWRQANRAAATTAAITT